jgi:hypothetical protein
MIDNFMKGHPKPRQVATDHHASSPVHLIRTASRPPTTSPSASDTVAPPPMRRAAHPSATAVTTDGRATVGTSRAVHRSHGHAPGVTHSHIRVYVLWNVNYVILLHWHFQAHHEQEWIGRVPDLMCFLLEWWSGGCQHTQLWERIMFPVLRVG